MSHEFATFTIGDKSYKLPILKGTRGDRAIDIRTLLKETGHITLDSGYMNTGACTSSITYLDGAKGILDYRGNERPLTRVFHEYLDLKPKDLNL